MIKIPITQTPETPKSYVASWKAVTDQRTASHMLVFTDEISTKRIVKIFQREIGVIESIGGHGREGKGVLTFQNLNRT